MEADTEPDLPEAWWYVMLTMGVEEEYFLVDPATRDLADSGLPDFGELRQQNLMMENGPSSFDYEFQLSMVESRTGICGSLADVRTDVCSLRDKLSGSASEYGMALLSAGTMPLADWRAARLTEKPRYARIAELYRDVVIRRATSGCHIHVGIVDRDLAAQALCRLQPWLPALLALSASSPFYESADTGYQSYRNILWAGFPVAGAPGDFASHHDYRTHVDLLIAAGAIVDAGNAFWDVRLGTNFKTIEFRIADALTTVDEVVLQAGLCRALVLRALRDIADGRPGPPQRPGLVRAATWRAARFGLDGPLIDVLGETAVPASQLVDRLLDHLRETLEELGDWKPLTGLVDEVRLRGTSARRQREVFARTGRLEDVVDHLLAETITGL